MLYAMPTIACFEGEDAVQAAKDEAEKAKVEAEKKAAEVRQAEEAAAAARESEFSQEDVNTFLAEDRRKHQEKYKQLEVSYQEIIADKTLAAEQREKLQGELTDLQKSFRTKEQQAEYERKQTEEKYTSDLAVSRDEAIKWENKFKTSMIQRELQDAAITGEAFNPHQIVGLLTPSTQMREETLEDGKGTGTFKVMIDFPDKDETTGEQISTLRTPGEAVQRMKELPELWGNLFRANVVSGIGSGAATGGATPGDGGRVDVSKLTPEQYRKLRKESPELLGLKRRTS